MRLPRGRLRPQWRPKRKLHPAQARQPPPGRGGDHPPGNSEGAEAEEPVSLSVQSGLWTSNVPGAGDPDKKLLSGGACVLPSQLRVLPRWKKQGADTTRLIRPLPGLGAHSRWFSLHVREPHVHAGLLRLGGSPKDRRAEHHPGLHHRDTGGETGLLQVLIPQLQHWTQGDSRRGLVSSPRL